MNLLFNEDGMRPPVTPKTGPPIKKNTLRDRMEFQSRLIATFFEKESQTGGVLVGTHNAQRLNRALMLGHLPHLIEKTLLSRAIHQHHTQWLFNRLVKQCAKKRNNDLRTTPTTN